MGAWADLPIAFLLTERGLLHKPVLHWSPCLTQRRLAYHERLQDIRDRGAREAGLTVFLCGVFDGAMRWRRWHDAFRTCEKRDVQRSRRSLAAPRHRRNERYDGENPPTGTPARAFAAKSHMVSSVSNVGFRALTLSLPEIMA